MYMCIFHIHIYMCTATFQEEKDLKRFEALPELGAIRALAVLADCQRGGLQPRPQGLAQKALQQRHQATALLGRLPLRPTDEVKGGLVSVRQAVQEPRELLGAALAWPAGRPGDGLQGSQGSLLRLLNQDSKSIF